jgi:hypothetical protein
VDCALSTAGLLIPPLSLSLCRTSLLRLSAPSAPPSSSSWSSSSFSLPSSLLSCHLLSLHIFIVWLWGFRYANGSARGCTALSLSPSPYPVIHAAILPSRDARKHITSWGLHGTGISSHRTTLKHEISVLHLIPSETRVSNIPLARAQPRHPAIHMYSTFSIIVDPEI